MRIPQDKYREEKNRKKVLLNYNSMVIIQKQIFPESRAREMMTMMATTMVNMAEQDAVLS